MQLPQPFEPPAIGESSPPPPVDCQGENCVTDIFCYLQMLAIYNDALGVYSQTLFEETAALLSTCLDTVANCGSQACADQAWADYLAGVHLANEAYKDKVRQAQQALVNQTRAECCLCDE